MLNKQEWNQKILLSAPKSGAFLQSWEWGEFQKDAKREVIRLTHGNALAQVISYPIRGSIFGWNLPRGPVGPTSDQAVLFENIISDLKKTKGIFLHVEPTEELPKMDKITPNLLQTKNKQPQHTLILDLSKDEDVLISEMHQKTRYNIRLASKKGVGVEFVKPNDENIERFWQILSATAKRDNFSLHSKPYYQKMIKALHGVFEKTTEVSTHLAFAKHENDILAAALFIRFGNTTTYLYGASSNTKRNLMAPHLVHWDAIKMAKQAGCNSYDFWGIAPEDQPNHPWAGITRFKLGFGGEKISMPRAVELPLKSIWYRIYQIAKKLRK